MNFTMQRDRTVASKHGHVIEFKKGVPTHVPSILYDEVMAAGAIPEEELPEPEAPVSKEPADPAERKALILAAIEEVARENDVKKFTAGGAPHAGVLTDILGFKIEARERDLLWAEFQRGGAA